MSELVQIMDYFSESIAPRRMEQYKAAQAPNLNALLEALGADADTLESALFSIRSGYYLDTAIGVQLDNLGALFGVAREGRTDADYRFVIRLRSAQRSYATPEDIISVLKGIFGATGVTYVPKYPAGFIVVTDAPITLQTLEAISPAGVGAQLGCYLAKTTFDDLICTTTGDLIILVGHVCITTIQDEDGEDILLEDGESLILEMV